jgi:hypothetical protein
LLEKRKLKDKMWRAARQQTTLEKGVTVIEKTSDLTEFG